MDNSILYSQEAVRIMLLAAYKAGFDGPLELADEIVDAILKTGAMPEAGVEFIEIPVEKPKEKPTSKDNHGFYYNRSYTTGSFLD